MKVEVRCCCDPGRLLGTVEVDRMPGDGEFFYWREPATFETPGLTVPETPVRPRTIALQACEYWHDTERRIAFKDDGMPIETLRRIPSFEENR